LFGEVTGVLGGRGGAGGEPLGKVGEANSFILE